MLDSLIRECRKHSVKKIYGYYIESSRNEMVSDLYKELGFTLFTKNKGSTVWSLNVNKYVNKNTMIEVKNE